MLVTVTVLYAVLVSISVVVQDSQIVTGDGAGGGADELLHCSHEFVLSVNTPDKQARAMHIKYRCICMVSVQVASEDDLITLKSLRFKI